MWNGDYRFLLSSLILKDFRIRYRNMSLGVLWALVNPLVVMGMLVLVFTKFFVSPAPDYPVFLLCGIVPLNFFTLAWAVGTVSVTDNAGLIKRVAVPRELIPVASVLAVLIHASIQLCLLFAFAFGFGKYPNIYWVFIPIIWGLLVAFVIGISWLFAGFNVYVRDTRYVVESVSTLLFWLAPIIYPLERIPPEWRGLYLWNPLSAAITCLRQVILEQTAPSLENLMKMTIMAAVAMICGFLVFRKMKARFYNYL